MVLSVIRVMGLGILGFATPRILVGAGVPLNEWATGFGVWLGLSAPWLEEWGLTVLAAFLAIVFSAIEAWWRPAQRIWRRILFSSSSKQKPGTNVHDDELGDQLQEISRDILEFISERRRIEPPEPKTRTWARDIDRRGKHSSETVSLYHQRFGARVVFLYEEVKKRGFEDAEVNQWYRYPTNEIGMTMLGQRLGALGRKIKDTI